MIRFIIFVCLLCANSCVVEKHNLSPVLNDSGKLKLDGYYYYAYKGFDNKIVVSIYFLFKNGVFYYQGSHEYPNSIDIMSILKSQNIEQQNIQNRNNYHTIRGFWGVYKIIGDSIIINQQMLGPGKRIIVKMGKIIDSNSFSLSEFRELGDNLNKKFPAEEFYYFKHSDSISGSDNIFFK